MPNTASLNYVLACQTEALLSFDLLKPCFVHKNTGHEFREVFRMFSVASFFVPGVGLGFFLVCLVLFTHLGLGQTVFFFLLCTPYLPNLPVSFLIL